MSRATTEGRAVRTRVQPAERCLALSGKGAPGAAELEEAVDALLAAASSLRGLKRRGGHDLKPGDPEVRLRSPRPGARGGSGWTVLVRVPAYVTARDAREAAEAAAHRRPVAKNIRLSPLDIADPRPKRARPGRDRLPGKIRKTRAGAPQHRAREMR